MAESQALLDYTSDAVVGILTSLSPERFATYLALASGETDAIRRERALAQYLYNARLAAAFLFPLHVVEVTLRNAVDGVLVGLYGPQWPDDSACLAKLTPQSRASLEKAKARAQRHEGRQAGSRGQVVAELSFDFWSNLFRSHYDRPLWQIKLREALPHCPSTMKRRHVQIEVRDINALRNRIAHHEPIFKLDVTNLHSRIVSLVAMRCPATASWLRSHSTVAATIRTKPQANNDGALTVAERADRVFRFLPG